MIYYFLYMEACSSNISLFHEGLYKFILFQYADVLFPLNCAADFTHETDKLWEYSKGYLSVLHRAWKEQSEIFSIQY